MADDNELMVKLTANAEGFMRDIQAASGSWTGFLRNLTGSSASLMTVGAGVVGAAAALFGLTKSTANAGEKLWDLHNQTGVSVESLSLLKYAAEQSGTNIEDLASGLKFLEKNMVAAQKPGSDQAQIFKALGIETKDLTGALRQPQEVMYDMADRLKGLHDPSLRTSVLLELMGRNSITMAEFLSQGSDGIKKLMEEGKGFAGWLTEDAQAADGFNDSLAKLWATIGSSGTGIGKAFLEPLTGLIDLLQATAIPAIKIFFGTLYGVSAGLMEMAAGLAAAYFGITKLTDALGITDKAAGDAKETMQVYHEEAKRLLEKADKYYKAVSDGAKEEAKINADLHDKKKTNIQLTDKQVEQALHKKEIDAAATKALKEAAEEEKKGLENIIKTIENMLDVKIAQKTFDEDYFELYRTKLVLQGKTAEQATAIITAMKKEQYDKETRLAEELTQKEKEESIKRLKAWLDNRLAYQGADEAYFSNYRKLLDLQYTDSDTKNRLMAEEAIRLGKETGDAEVKCVLDTNKIKETAINGVADSIKSIWGGTTQTFTDVWHGAADVFVDVMAQMVISTEVTTTAIKIQMAAATAGISLVVGMLSMALGGKGKSIKVEPVTVRLKKVFDDFVKDFKGAVGEFKEKLFPAKGEMEKNKAFIMAATDWLKQAKENPLYTTSALGIVSHVNSASLSAEFQNMLKDMGISWKYKPISDFIVDLTKKLSENLTSITSLMVERFNKIKNIVGDILDLYKRQGDFTKDMDKTILDVQRSLFSPEQTFTAQLGDIELLKTAVAGAVGENQVSLVGDLKAAYLTAWESAQGIFGEDAIKLAEWQKFTVAGLEELKGVGKSAYDKLIDINLDMLGLQRSGVDLQTQMTTYLSSLDTNIVSTLKAIQDIGTTNTATDTQLSLLTTTLASLFDIPMMAAGGVVTRPTLAMIGESGPEAVVPLSKMGSAGGGNVTNHISLSFPGVKDIRDLSTGDYEQMVKRMLHAAENLNRRGYRWTMQPRTA